MMKIQLSKDELKQRFIKNNVFFTPMMKGMVVIVFLIYLLQLFVL